MCCHQQCWGITWQQTDSASLGGVRSSKSCGYLHDRLRPRNHTCIRKKARLFSIRSHVGTAVLLAFCCPGFVLQYNSWRLTWQCGTALMSILFGACEFSMLLVPVCVLMPAQKHHSISVCRAPHCMCPSALCMLSSRAQQRLWWNSSSYL